MSISSVVKHSSTTAAQTSYAILPQDIRIRILMMVGESTDLISKMFRVDCRIARRLSVRFIAYPHAMEIRIADIPVLADPGAVSKKGINIGVLETQFAQLKTQIEHRILPAADGTPHPMAVTINSALNRLTDRVEECIIRRQMPQNSVEVVQVDGEFNTIQQQTHRMLRHFMQLDRLLDNADLDLEVLSNIMDAFTQAESLAELSQRVANGVPFRLHHVPELLEEQRRLAQRTAVGQAAFLAHNQAQDHVFVRSRFLSNQAIIGRVEEEIDRNLTRAWLGRGDGNSGILEALRLGVHIGQLDANDPILGLRTAREIRVALRDTGRAPLLAQITRLDLDNLALTHLPDEVVDYFPGLNRLKLHDNQLTALPDRMRQLTNLKKLLLDNNRFDRFPEPLLHMRKLAQWGFDKGISLTGNPIPRVSEEVYEWGSFTNTSWQVIGNTPLPLNFSYTSMLAPSLRIDTPNLEVPFYNWLGEFNLDPVYYLMYPFLYLLDHVFRFAMNGGITNPWIAYPLVGLLGIVGVPVSITLCLSNLFVRCTLCSWLYPLVTEVRAWLGYGYTIRINVA